MPAYYGPKGDMSKIPPRDQRHGAAARAGEKHGPDGSGEAGPCDPGCWKCLREMASAEAVIVWFAFTPTARSTQASRRLGLLGAHAFRDGEQLSLCRAVPRARVIGAAAPDARRCTACARIEKREDAAVQRESRIQELEHRIELDGSLDYFWSDGEQVYRSKRSPGDDVARGLCSGIPRCCIDFYLGGWQPIMGTAEGDLYLASMNEAGGDGYVACPRCIFSATFVKVRQCGPECSCGQWQTREPVGVQLQSGTTRATFIELPLLRGISEGHSVSLHASKEPKRGAS